MDLVAKHEHDVGVRCDKRAMDPVTQLANEHDIGARCAKRANVRMEERFFSSLDDAEAMASAIHTAATCASGQRRLEVKEAQKCLESRTECWLVTGRQLLAYARILEEWEGGADVPTVGGTVSVLASCIDADEGPSAHASCIITFVGSLGQACDPSAYLRQEADWTWVLRLVEPHGTVTECVWTDGNMPTAENMLRFQVIDGHGEVVSGLFAEDLTITWSVPQVDSSHWVVEGEHGNVVIVKFTLGSEPRVPLEATVCVLHAFTTQLPIPLRHCARKQLAAFVRMAEYINEMPPPEVLDPDTGKFVDNEAYAACEENVCDRYVTLIRRVKPELFQSGVMLKTLVNAMERMQRVNRGVAGRSGIEVALARALDGVVSDAIAGGGIDAEELCAAWCTGVSLVCKAAFDARWISVVERIMEAYPGSERVQCVGCTCLRLAMSNKQPVNVLLVWLAAKTHPSSADVQAAAMTALNRASGMNFLDANVSVPEVVEWVLQVLNDHRHSRTVYVASHTMAGELCRMSAEFTAAFVAGGGLDTLSRTLFEHKRVWPCVLAITAILKRGYWPPASTVTEILVHVCARALAHDSGAFDYYEGLPIAVSLLLCVARSPEHCPAVLAAGGIDCLCFMVPKLTTISGATMGYVALRVLAKARAEDVAMRILPHFCDVVSSTARGARSRLGELFRLMAALCESGTVSRAIVMANLPKVLAGMMLNMDGYVAQAVAARGQAARVLAELAEASPADAVTIASAGGFECLVHAMRSHQTEIGVQNRVLRALCTLCSRGPETHAAFVESGALPLVIAAMDAFLSSENLQGKACVLMLSLASYSGVGRAAAVDCGAVPRLIAARDTHPTVASISTNVAAALSLMG